METIVHQPLGDVFFSDASRFLEATAVKNELVSNSSLVASVEHLVVVLQLFGHIVGVQNRFLSYLA